MPDKQATPYFTARMQQLGITAAANTFPYEPDTFGDEKQVINQVIFEPDEHDNIRINYYNLLGDKIRWTKDGTKNVRPYYRLRLKEPKGDMKYWQEKGSGQEPFFPPKMIIKYRKREEIDTLFLVEGEFKAFKGSMVGIDIVGIPSIHGFYNGDVAGKLHEYIQEFIISCKVKRIVFLTDADTITVNWAPDKDLSRRPNSFYSAVKYFRQSLQLLMDNENLPLKHAFWMHIDAKYVDLDAKGLDDLLVKYEGETEAIKKDIMEFQFALKYFRGYNLTDDPQFSKVKAALGLGNETEFYNTYKKYIGHREFIFRKRRYHFDGENVKYVKHEDCDRFMRVGPDYLKVVQVPNKHGDLETDLIPWKKSEITSDYKKYPDFLENIPKYDAFCNEPNWNGHFKKVHNGCINICEPLVHVPKDGDFPTIKKFLKHIFSGEGDFGKDVEGDQFTVGLDYLCIQLQYPKQMLPVPILVSPEFKTGKSTFLKWLQAVFGNNMAILGNEQFKMRFNAHYITKFIIAIDEGFLEVDKKAEKERLKQLATADTVYLENKGMNVKKVPYYGKLIICSNDADRVMKIDEGENRWFVVRVYPIKDEDPQLEEKMRSEIPAWLHYAMHRKIFHKYESRLWFHERHFITDQFRIIVEETKNRLDRLIEDFVRDLFLTYHVTEINVGLKTLVQKLNEEGTKYRIDREDLRSFLQKKKNLTPAPYPVAQSYPNGWDDNGVSMISQKQRCYTLHYTDWLTDAEIEEFNNRGEEAAHASAQNSKPGSASSGQTTVPF